MRILIRGGSTNESCQSLCKNLELIKSEAVFSYKLLNVINTDMKYFRCYNYKLFSPGNSEDVSKLTKEDIICTESMPNKERFLRLLFAKSNSMQ